MEAEVKKQTLAALKLSIAHWRRMATGRILPAEAPTASQCPLCDLFLKFRDASSKCQGCPVAEKAYSHCGGTPYHQAWNDANLFGIYSDEFKASARLELAFLRSLLPKKRAGK